MKRILSFITTILITAVGQNALAHDVSGKIAAGDYNIMYIKNDGSLWRKGSDYYKPEGKYTYSNEMIKLLDDALYVASSGNNTFAIKQDNSLWAWGSNTNGEIGDGTKDSREYPFKIMTDVTQVAAGYTHILAIKKDGTLWAWGNNSYGELCDGTKDSKRYPVKVMNNVAQVAAGSSYSLIVKKDGTLWVCGNGSRGELGTGNTSNKGTPVKIMDGVLKVAAGSGHSVILKKDGSLWTCGYNGHGQIGDGTQIDCFTPKRIMDDIIDISAGSYNTFAIRSDHTLWAWGYNEEGQTAGKSSSELTPTRIMEDVEEVSASYYRTMVRKTDGTIWACGYWKDFFGIESKNTVHEPTQINSLNNISCIDTGYLHSLVVDKEGNVYSFGKNDYGQLGDGTLINHASPVHIMTNVSKVSTDNDCSLALKKDGTLWFWGWLNFSGDGDKSWTPKEVMRDVADMYAGSSHCFAIKRDGSLWAWGSNSYGVFGNGKTGTSKTPIKIMENITMAVPGYNNSFILKKDGTLWACGQNYSGWLGDGTDTDRPSPVKIMSDVAWVCTAGRNTFAIKKDGSLWGWGKNDSGQLGDGTKTNRMSPVKVMDNVSKVSTDEYSTLVIKKNGTLWELGNTNKKIMENVVDVAHDYSHTLIIKSDGSLWTLGGSGYGDNGLGEIGYCDVFQKVGDTTKSDNITIATINSNKPLIEVARKQGWISNTATEMTKEDAEKVTDLGTAFKGNKDIISLNELEYFTGLKKLVSYAFENCSNLASINIPNSVTEIGTFCFLDCSSLINISISKNVSFIGHSAFAKCEKLEKIEVETGNPNYYSQNGVLFKYNNVIHSYPIGKKGAYTIPNGIKEIESYCFYYSSITQMTIPDGITSIGPCAFCGCSSLQKISLPSSLTYIASYCFSECGNLEEITIPENVRSINFGAFAECNKLKMISVNSKNSYYTDIDGVLFSNDKKTIHTYPNGKSANYTIPEGVTTIFSHCFYNSKITHVDLPSTLKEIQYGGFWNTKIEEITLPPNVTSIDGNGLASNSLKQITSLIPTPIAIGNDVFYDVTYHKAVLSVPSGAKTAYQSANGWKLFENIVEAEDNNVIETNCAGIIAGTDGTVYRVTGTCTSITNTTYGNWYLTDNSGQVYIYGTLDQYGNTKNFLSWGLEVGDIVTVEGPRNNYNGIIELVNVTVQNIKKTKATYSSNGVDYELNMVNNTAKVKRIIANQTDLIIPSSLNYNGGNYTVTAVGDSIFYNSKNSLYLFSVSFPNTITEVADKTFETYGTSAIVWNSDTNLPQNAFKGEKYQNGNFLLYVNKADIAPSGVSNLVVNSIADNITLIDKAVFYCPQEFTARKISYTHNYQMQTGIDESAGWETIALPFDVTMISHESKGNLVPFTTWQEEAEKKPFWLYRLTGNGFVKASAIKANTPYIISMPNNNKYSIIYNVAGKVTFSATNAKIYRTLESDLNTVSYNSGTFMPIYSFYEKDNSIYAMNITNDNTTYTGNEKPGSIFLNNMRYVYPFEAIFYKNFGTRSIEIVFVDDVQTNEIQGIITNERDQIKQVRIYNLGGQLVGIFNKDELFDLNKKIPAGVYLVNGKKTVVK